MVDFNNKIITSPFSAGHINPINGRNDNMEKRKFKKRLKKEKKSSILEKSISDNMAANDDIKEITETLSGMAGKIIDIKV